MPESGSRRRSSDQRNVLYNEPSMFGVLMAIAVIVVIIAVILVVLFGDVLPAGH